MSAVVTEAADGAAERRSEQRGWYFYDWACSVYSTSVLTVFLGPYLTAVAKAAADADGFRASAGHPGARGLLLRVLRLCLGAAVGVRDAAGGRGRRPYGPQEAAAGGRGLSGRGARRRACSSWTATAICWAALLLIVANASFAVSMVLYNSYPAADRRRPRSGTRSPRGAGPSATRRARWSWSRTWSCSSDHDDLRRLRGRRPCGSAWPRPACGGAPSRSYRCGGCATGRARSPARGCGRLSGWRQLRGHRARHAPPPADAALPAGLSRLQRRRPDGDLAGVGLRLGGAGPRPDDADRRGAAGPGAGGGGRAAAWGGWPGRTARSARSWARWSPGR